MKGNWKKILPLLVGIVALVTLAWWWLGGTGEGLKLRIPGTDAAPGGESGAANPVLAGKLIAGTARPADLPGNWPQFRGPNRDGISPATVSISRDWKITPPREIWSLEAGEGYAGVAIRSGCAFLLDYVRDTKQSALRCLSLADGKEIWRFSYPLTIKRNHGMTRTVPTLADKFVVALDSKGHVLCLDAASGDLKWSICLVREFGATIPEWYAGQCPLVEGDKVILAPGGKDALLLAVDLATGKPLWQTSNPRGWKMTHSSIMPMEFAGRRLYVYCASGGVVGVDAKDGALLWETSDWKISIATVPSPVPLPEGRIFLTGGYGAGSLMLQLLEENGKLAPKTLFKLTPNVFGATQHTPIFKDGHLYGIRADGRFVCLGLDGKVVWASGPTETFGLGPLLMAGDVIFALQDSGKLRLIEASSARFNLLSEAEILSQGREAWAPMALAGSRLIARDLTRLVCLEVGAK
jgi:outer membrane protein assembly factor BamB